MSFLFAWLGNRDLDASDSKGPPDPGELGPIADAVRERKPSRVVVLSAQEPAKTQKYGTWLRGVSETTDVQIRQTEIQDPWDFGRIYHESAAAIEEQNREGDKPPPLIFHLSPGTGAMSASWIILSKTRFPAELIQSSQQDPTTGCYPIRTVNLPFDLSIELIGDLLRKSAEDIVRLSQSLPPANADFAKIVHRSPVMEEVIVKARKVALWGDVSVLILGESGTGKELLARAIHTASPRAKRPFIARNCGAIPAPILESELFGHVKSAFTDARHYHAGVFEQGHGGTVFLEEVGELSKAAQAALLRVLQERVVMPVGGEESDKKDVDVRVIAATNRDLHKAVAQQEFREDLFYRLAVAVIQVPPLRDRPQDIELLADHFLKDSVFQTAASLLGGPIKLGPAARRRLRQHYWPGNVRELQNTLIRAALWSSSNSISEIAIDDALLLSPQANQDVLSRPLGDGFSLPALLDEMRRQYLERALHQANQNQRKAAELLGLTRQTFANWLGPGRNGK